jgi:hypothetical protein
MFRYIAFSWAVANEGQNALARRLAGSLIDSGWHRAFSSSGFSVYVVGHRRGVNDVYTLPSHAGVVLGRLFRRASPLPARGEDIELTEHEGDEIVRSEGRAPAADWRDETSVLGRRLHAMAACRRR